MTTLRNSIERLKNSEPKIIVLALEDLGFPKLAREYHEAKWDYDGAYQDYQGIIAADPESGKECNIFDLPSDPVLGKAEANLQRLRAQLGPIQHKVDQVVGALQAAVIAVEGQLAFDASP